MVISMLSAIPLAIFPKVEAVAVNHGFYYVAVRQIIECVNGIRIFRISPKCGLFAFSNNGLPKIFYCPKDKCLKAKKFVCHIGYGLNRHLCGDPKYYSNGVNVKKLSKPSRRLLMACNGFAAVCDGNGDGGGNTGHNEVQRCSINEMTNPNHAGRVYSCRFPDVEADRYRTMTIVPFEGGIRSMPQKS